MDRRDFMRTGLALGGAVLASTTGCATATASAPASQAAAAPPPTDFWEAFRGEFDLSRDDIHLSHFLLTPHHRSVREAIEMYRRAFDTNPLKAFRQFATAEAEVSRAAAAYLEVKPGARRHPLLRAPLGAQQGLRAAPAAGARAGDGAGA